MNSRVLPVTMKALALIGLLVAAACSIDVPTTARSGPTAVADRARTKALPGSNQTFADGSLPLNCIPKNPSYGSALIGPAGGDLIIGPNRLVVPAGALTDTVTISGTVPDSLPFQINLQPHGLQFKKAAGLILDASSCTTVPNIVYLIDQFTVSDPIQAVYSNFWHTIACPIWHFSGYSVYFDNAPDDGSDDRS
jgi:hypothetical protein